MQKEVYGKKEVEVKRHDVKKVEEGRGAVDVVEQSLELGRVDGASKPGVIVPMSLQNAIATDAARICNPINHQNAWPFKNNSLVVTN